MKWWPMLAVLLFGVSAAAGPVLSPIHASITTQTGKEIPLTLELAATEPARQTGLMHRKELHPHDGMAFFFPQASVQKFWMKNTLLPLDILFVDAKQKIVYIGHGVPHSLEPIGPDSAVATVIELAAGRAKREGITLGDQVHYAIATTTYALAD